MNPGPQAHAPKIGPEGLGGLEGQHWRKRARLAHLEEDPTHLSLDAPQFSELINGKNVSYLNRLR